MMKETAVFANQVVWNGYSFVLIDTVSSNMKLTIRTLKNNIKWLTDQIIQ
jgi:hypothetical protein